MSNSYKFFNNRECKYFPCHKGILDEDFNCLFCYCPLYMLEEKCGGNFKITRGIKNCSECKMPHIPNNYEYINKKLGEYIREMAKKREEE